MNIAAQLIEWVFSSPFLWMTLLGVVLWHSLHRHTVESSLVYAPLIEEKLSYNLGGTILFSFLLGTASALFVFYTNSSLDILYVIGIWFVSFAFSMKGKETIGFLFTAFLFGTIAYILDETSTVTNVLRYAGSYQLIIGILYLFSKKETFPIMQQEKDGRVHGEHIFKAAWIMPAAVLSTAAISSFLAPTTMIVMLLFSEIRINRETPRSYFLRNGIFSCVAGIVLILISFIAYDLFVIIGVIVSLALFAFWVIEEALYNKKRDFIFIADDTGIKILYVYPETIAFEMGIKAGDKITHINDRRIVSFQALETFLDEKPPFIWIKFIRQEKQLEGEFKDYSNGIGDLGIVAVPRNPSKYELHPRKGYFAKKFEKLFSKNKNK